ncbi:MAG: hypothetical protein PF501_03520 [Salinisphaera sp.]|jgi:uncharacterized membrane protein YGL010W|nr:hypothetical protein [Salinisphaera sp.]
MFFDDYPHNKFDENAEKAVIIMPIVAAFIAIFYLWSQHIGFMLGSRAGVSIALLLFAPAFAFFRTLSVRFAMAVLSALVVISWPGVWFEILDKLTTPSYLQVSLSIHGLPWWDTGVFKVAVETTFAIFLGAYLWCHRMIIDRLFCVVWDLWRR